MGGWGSIYSSTRAMLRLHAQELAKLQEMAASGARISRTSDAPSDAFRIFGLRAESASTETYLRNLSTVVDTLNMATSVAQHMSEIMTRVRELVTQSVTGTYSQRNRAPIAQEIDSLLQQLVTMVNTKFQGQYLFAGADVTSAPYLPVYENGKIVRVDYVGSLRSVEVPVAPGVDFASVLVGDEIFRNNERQAPEVLGQTGAAAGAGTASARGDVWLTVTHESTTYLGASGVASGASSATGDTILGNGHTLTIDALASTLQLNAGTLVTFTPGDTNVRVTGAQGEVVYVDVSGLVPGFVGTVNIQTTGKLSIDDGASEVAIDYADTALAVTHLATGRVLYVDCTGIRCAGLDLVRVPGTYDMFATLVTIRDMLTNARGLSEDRQMNFLGETVKALTEATTGLAQMLTSVGSRLGAMESLRDGLENVKAFTDDEAAKLENADIVIVAADLARRQTLYEMTLAAASRLLRLSLLDFI